MIPETDNRKAEQTRRAAIVLEPSIQTANRILEAVRDARKRLGRDVRAVWMPPPAYCVVLMTAELPPRALDEVIGMGMPAVAAEFDGFALRLDPPSLERRADGSLFVIARAWSDEPSFQAMIGQLVRVADRAGIEAVLEGDTGLKVLLGWIPGPCELSGIPGQPVVQAPVEFESRALAAGMLEMVGSSPMEAFRRIRIGCFRSGFEKHM